jgi:RNA polymerase-binding transcription factor DksA
MSDLSSPATGAAVPAPKSVDLDAIERDLADIEAALGRLDNGTYFTDEVTGQPIADSVLEANPLARRNP